MFLDYLFRVSDRTWKIIIISQSIWLIIFWYTFPISSPEIARKKLIKILSIYIFAPCNNNTLYYIIDISQVQIEGKRKEKIVITPGHPPTMAISSVRENIERHIRGHVRIFVFGRDHVWIKWRHGTPAGADIYTVLHGLAVPIPAAGRALACTWTRKIVSVCVGACTLVCSRGGGGGMWHTWNILAIRSSILHWRVTCVAGIGIG